MKLYAVIIFLFFLHFNSFSQNSLRGRIIAAPTSYVFLYQHKGYQLKKISTAEINHRGDFYFTIPAELAIRKGFYRLQFNDSAYADLVLSPDEKISIYSDGFRMQDSLRVSGSPENNAFFSLRKIQLAFFDSIKNLQNQYAHVDPINPNRDKLIQSIERNYSDLLNKHNADIRTFIRKNKNTFTATVAQIEILPRLSEHPEMQSNYKNEAEFLRDHFLDSVDFSAPELMNGSAIFDKYILYLEQYAAKSMDGFKKSIDYILKKTTANPLLYKESVQFLAETFEERGPEELFLYIVDTYTESCEDEGEYKDVIKSKEKILSLGNGKPAPDIQLPDSAGTGILLSDVIRSNHAVLVLFWASWCEHCQETLPKIREMYNKFKNKGFQVYAVSLDTEKSDWTRFIRENQLNWLNVCDFNKWKSKAALDYFVKKTPQYYLLDHDGKISGKNISMSLLKQKLENLNTEK